MLSGRVSLFLTLPPDLRYYFKAQLLDDTCLYLFLTVNFVIGMLSASDVGERD